MMHSITMTIDQRYKLSAAAWILAAICAIFLFESAKALQNSHASDMHTAPTSTSSNYGYIGGTGS
jgi:hypothetical protein